MHEAKENVSREVYTDYKYRQTSYAILTSFTVCNSVTCNTAVFF